MRVRSYLLVITAATLLCAPLACQQPTRTAGAPGELPLGQPVAVQPRIDAATLYAHGNLLERQGNLEGALTQYTRALAANPNFIAARNRQGIVLNKLGRHPDATVAFQAAVSSGPAQAYLYNNLGFSLYLEGKYQEARGVLEKTLELRPDFARAHMNYALVLAKLGDLDAALGELRHAGSDVEVCYNFALLQAEAGRYGDAAHSLERALTLDPTYEPAREQMRNIARLVAEEEGRNAAAATAAANAAAAASATAAPSQAANAVATPQSLTGSPTAQIAPATHTSASTPATLAALTASAPPTNTHTARAFFEKNPADLGAWLVRRWYLEARPSYFESLMQ